MDESEKIFNYQLTIAKLEEECNLYRNGTTGTELLELIAEKDSELKQLNVELSEKKDIIQKVAKSSAEVLEKCQLLQADNVALTSTKKILEKTVVQHEATIKGCESHIESLKESQNKLNADLDRSSEELSLRFDDISKLQSRCAALVAEKTEKSRALEMETAAHAKQIKKYKEEVKKLKESLESAQNSLVCTQAANEKLNLEMSSSAKELRGLQTKYDTETGELRASVATLTQEKLRLSEELMGTRQELHTTGQNVSSLTLQSSQMSQTMEMLLQKKDTHIQELKDQVASLESLLASKTQSSTVTTTTSTSAVAIVNSESIPPVPPVPHQHTSAPVAVTTKSSRQGSQSGSRNHSQSNISRARESETLDMKIKRQEEYLRQRFLKDKTNTHH